MLFKPPMVGSALKPLSQATIKPTIMDSFRSLTNSLVCVMNEKMDVSQFYADSPPTVVPLIIKPHFEALTEKQKLYAHYISRSVSLPYSLCKSWYTFECSSLEHLHALVCFLCSCFPRGLRKEEFHSVKAPRSCGHHLSSSSYCLFTPGRY